MNFKKMGIKVILVTIALLFLTKYIPFNPYLRISMGVFGIGAGFVLLLADGYRHFGP